MPITVKQQRFVEEYLVDLNATQAALRAGYSPHTAKEQAARLLSKANVAAEIEKAIQARSERTRITADRVVWELASMGLYDPGDIAQAEIKGPRDIASLPDQVRRAIIGWSWDRYGNFVLKLSPKTPSLELIGRHLGMFKDKLEVTGSVSLEEITAAARAYEQEQARIRDQQDRATLN